MDEIHGGVNARLIRCCLVALRQQMDIGNLFGFFGFDFMRTRTNDCSDFGEDFCFWQEKKKRKKLINVESSMRTIDWNANYLEFYFVLLENWCECLPVRCQDQFSFYWIPVIPPKDDPKGSWDYHPPRPCGRWFEIPANGNENWTRILNFYWFSERNFGIWNFYRFDPFIENHSSFSSDSILWAKRYVVCISIIDWNSIERQNEQKIERKAEKFIINKQWRKKIDLLFLACDPWFRRCR